MVDVYNYGPGRIDFSPLADIGKTIAGGLSSRWHQNAVKQAIDSARNPDGSLNYDTAYNNLLRAGALDEARSIGTYSLSKSNQAAENAYREGMLGIAKEREGRLSNAPSVTPYQQRMMDMAERRLKLSEQAATRLPQNTIGAVAMLDAADKQLTSPVRDLLTRDWSIPESAQSAIAMGDVGRAQRAVRTKVEAALRLMTGAAAPEQEVKRYTDMFMPGMYDAIPTKKQKLQALDDFANNARNNAMQGREGDAQPPAAPSAAPSQDPNTLYPPVPGAMQPIVPDPRGPLYPEAQQPQQGSVVDYTHYFGR